MDYNALNRTCVLKVNINCCKGCQTRVEKALLKTNGVCSVTIDAEKRIVTVLGKADPKTLMKVLAKKGKKAEVLSYEEEEPKNDKNQHEDDQFENKHAGQDKGSRGRGDKIKHVEQDKIKHVDPEEKVVQDCHGEDCSDHDQGGDKHKHSRTRKEDFDDDHVYKDDQHRNPHNRSLIICNNCLPQHSHEHLYWDDPRYHHPPYGDGLMDQRHYGFRDQRLFPSVRDKEKNDNDEEDYDIRPIVYNRPLPPCDTYHPRMVPPPYAYHPCDTYHPRMVPPPYAYHPCDTYHPRMVPPPYAYHPQRPL